MLCGTLQVLRDAQVMIERMEHRGGWSCDNDTGDGAGVLTGIPHELYAHVLRCVISLISLVMSLVITHTLGTLSTVLLSIIVSVNVMNVSADCRPSDSDN